MVTKKRRRKTRGQGIVASLRDPDKIRVAYIIAGLALVFGGSLGFSTGTCDKQSSSNSRTGNLTAPEDIIARIEDREITYRDFAHDLQAMRKRVEQQNDTVLNPPEFDIQVQYQTLRQMLDMEYFDIKAKEAGITVTNADIDAKMLEFRQMLVPPRTYAQDRSILQRIQDAMTSAKEDQAFEAALRNLDPNMSIIRLREITKQELLAQKYVAQVTSEKDQEILGELTTKANTLREEIIGGTEFSEVARRESNHEDSAQAGGLVPLVKHNATNLPQSVIDSIFSLPVDEVSLPVTSSQEDFKGVWLIKVISRKEAAGEAWDSAKESIRQRLLEEKRTKVESGELTIAEGENLTVTDDEVKTAYEEATVYVIFLKAEDSMQRVQDAVRDDQATMEIEIFDPEIRAMFNLVNKNYELASIDYFQALKENQAALDPAADNQYAVEMQEAKIRYMLANMWGGQAYAAQSDWMMGIWSEFQANPDAFGGNFPETPESIQQEQQGYYVLALKNLDRAIEIEDMDPWFRVQRASIDLAREQLSTRVISDLETANEYSSRDLNLLQRILQTLQQAVAIDDRLLGEAGGTRPDTFTEPVFPEDGLGITLADLDKPFQDMAAAEVRTILPPPAPDETEVSEEGLIVSSEGSDEDVAPAEEEPGVTIEGSASAGISESVVTTEENLTGNDAGTTNYLPEVPVPEPYGPLSQELRDRLDSLLSIVQSVVDELNAQKQAAEAERQQQLQNQIDQMDTEGAPNNEEIQAPSENAENLLDNGTGTE